MPLRLRAVERLERAVSGGTLTLSTVAVDLVERRVPGRNLTPGRYAVLTVADTGEGMTAEAGG